MPCQAPFCILFSSQKQREAPLYSPRLRIHLPIVKSAPAACLEHDQWSLLAFKPGITHGLPDKPKRYRDGLTCTIDNRVNTISLHGLPDKPKRYWTGTISSSLVEVLNLDGICIFKTITLRVNSRIFYSGCPSSNTTWCVYGEQQELGHLLLP